MNLYHDSRDETYRCPAGAQPCGASVRLFLQTDAPDAIVRFWVDDHAYLYPMHAVSGGFEYTFSLPEKPCMIALDGEREVKLFAGDRADFIITDDGPWRVLPRKALSRAQELGMFRA